MERQWSGNARRLSQADRAEIERLIWGGETFETAAAAVGCSTKSIQRYLALTGGLKRRVKERSALRLSLADRETPARLVRSTLWGDCDATGRALRTRARLPGTGHGRYRAWSGRQLGGQVGHDPSPRSCRRVTAVREVERGLRPLVSSTDRGPPDLRLSLDLSMRRRTNDLSDSLRPARGALRK